jgi:hypothetical protein
MAFVYVPNGIIMDQWTPATEGPIASLPEKLPTVLQPLTPFRKETLILSGLTQNGGRALGDGPGDHARAAASYLTGVHPKKTFGADIAAGISVDQIAAAKLASTTRFASLELSCEEGLLGGNCDNGYSCAYSNAISWRAPASPMPSEISPRAVFERLFGGDDFEETPAARARRLNYERSILDYVLDDARRLQSAVGASDRRKLDEYLFAVRDIEKRIESSERAAAGGPPPVPKPGRAVPADFAAHSRLMFDLITVAFQTDLTRVVTFMMSLEQSNRNYREIDISESHHGLSHHRGDREKIEKLARINRFHVEQFCYFLDKLRSTSDGDGTLLDHSMIVYGAGLADGNRHEHHNLPTLLAGRAGGSIHPGRHIRYPAETPMNNLFIAMLDRMGVPAESLGDSNGRVGYLSDM